MGGQNGCPTVNLRGMGQIPETSENPYVKTSENPYVPTS
jgi:hypothetical protein